ncbi:MAG: hypothetical protein RL095_3313 [Verrucomicrobiota bacterium]|jgi:uncharacterized protein (AIM24 family)
MGDNRYTLSEFVRSSSQKELGHGLFELESSWMLEVNLDGKVWTKLGSMTAYRGDIRFTREGMLDQGLGNLFKKAISGEGLTLTKAEGRGKLYLADGAKRVTVLRLEGEKLVVNGNDVLAFEPTLNHEITMMRRISAMLAGGLFNVAFSGHGLLAITTQGEPLTLKVTPGSPVFTDPNATVAWSGSLQPEFRTDISLKTLFGRGSGESLQMVFKGEGFVVIQPYEEVYMQQAPS